LRESTGGDGVALDAACAEPSVVVAEETVSKTSNYRGQSLRRTSFRGMDRDGADFSNADLRGADFTDASLVEANFADAKLGVTPSTGVLLLVIAVMLAGAAGVVTGWLSSETRDRMFSGEWQATLGGVTIVFLTLVLFGFLLVKGADWAVRAFAVAFAVSLTINLVVGFIYGEVNVGVLARTVGLMILFGLAVVAGIVARMVGGAFGPFIIVVVALIGGIATGRADGGIGTIVVSVLLVVIAKRAMRLDQRDRPILTLAQRIVTARGTRFTNANLTRADFTGTLLTYSDMTNAVLSGTTWDSGKGPLVVDDGGT
jgi:uncharacterized protein YjbI with pentapeptide repeats